MISPDDQRPLAEILRQYQSWVATKHPTHVASWPLLNGWNLLSGSFRDWDIFVLKDAGFSSMTRQDGLGELSEDIIKVSEIMADNVDQVRGRLQQHFRIGPRDAVLFWLSDNNLAYELSKMLARHEMSAGLSPMKIFLSHKGANKLMVREYKSILENLGFDPWLDEDAMPAGTNLERGILKGFTDSCAAVFFITPQFLDESYISTEVDYAIAERRSKGDNFAIVSLVFADGNQKGTVPSLLRREVWKEPISQLEALREIIRAIPVRVGPVGWRLP